MRILAIESLSQPRSKTCSASSRSPAADRNTAVEIFGKEILSFVFADSIGQLTREDAVILIETAASTLLHRELDYAGLLSEGASYSARLLGCLDMMAPGGTAG